jgi:hypothetical protein
MEPIEWFLVMSLIVGGNEWWEKHEKNKDGVIVVEKPLYQRGKFYKNEDGYYISNLSPKPRVETIIAERGVDSYKDPLATAQANK